jgi:hypothetical protein
MLISLLRVRGSIGVRWMEGCERDVVEELSEGWSYSEKMRIWMKPKAIARAKGM